MTIQTSPAGQLGFDFSAPVPASSATPATDDDRTPSQRRADQARATLEAGLSGLRDDPAALAGYLAFSALFRDYSARNRLLVYLQRPRARFCKGYRDWLKNGRQVRKGEKALTILAPLVRRPTKAEVAAGADADRCVPFGFRAVAVFDYEQTDAVRDDALVYEPPMIRLDADGPSGLSARIEAAITETGYTVETRDTGYADGRCRFADKIIEVRAGLSAADRASVLAHELAHAVAHHPGAENRRSRASTELQAEGAAYVALAALGLDTARTSLPYLKNWADDDDALASELAAIDQIATQLLDLVDAAGRTNA